MLGEPVWRLDDPHGPEPHPEYGRQNWNRCGPWIVVGDPIVGPAGGDWRDKPGYCVVRHRGRVTLHPCPLEANRVAMELRHGTAAP